MKFIKRIPSADGEMSARLMAEGWKRVKEPPNLLYSILCSIPLMAVNGIVTFLAIKPFYDPLTSIIKSQAVSFEINIVSIVTVLASFFILLAAHEFLHALFIPNFISSDKTCWGISVNGAFVFTTETLTRTNFVIITIAPFVFLSFLLPLVFALSGLMTGLLFFLAVFNAMASSVDILNLVLILVQIPRKGLIVNNGFETYYYCQ